MKYVFRLILLLVVFTTLLSFVSCDLSSISIVIPNEEPLLTEYTFSVPDSYTVRDGYLSGTTSPSISVNLAEVFDLQALADQGYKCNVEVTYSAQVKGDHLNLRCSFGGMTDETGGYVYLDHNEYAKLNHTSYNISGSSYVSNGTLYVKWNCQGVTFLDGLNECVVSDIRISVRFV